MIWIAGLWSLLVGAKQAQKAYDESSSSEEDFGTKGGGKLPTKGKSMLVVGDSHTFATNSWGEAIKNKYGLASLAKVAGNGKTTSWMLSNLNTYLATKPTPDYIFIWGGTNDIYGNLTETQAAKNTQDGISNIQAMINAGNKKGSKVIVVTGYDPLKVSTSFDLSRMYKGATQDALRLSAKRLSSFYSSLQKNLKGAYAIVPPYPSFTRTNSTDGIHLKMPNYKILGEYVGSKVF